ncbi:M56 family metallopeptidase [Flavobacterium sp. ZB4R12]|uniref:M56 family metallopeptidase n=1 Tax=Flavobacterium sp. ZB4R12 TaxID=3398732 RepID=UPI003AAB66D9
MILYILKSSLLLFILITVYKLLLENEKMHHFNRIYLLGSLIFSLTIPLQLFSFKTKISDTITHFQLNEILLQKTSENLSTITDNQMINYTAVTIYLLVALLLIIRFVLNLYSFYKKIKNNEQQTLNGNKVVLIQEPVVPHSFLNSIFFYEQDFKNNNIAPELIVHEAVHIKQKHTLDILFIEVLQILFWFNPLILLYKHAIKLNHEFLADETVNAKFNSVFYYQKMLLNIASNQRKIALASSINYLITKKRLIMMTKKESKTRIILKTVGVGVIFSLLLFSFSPETMAQESPNIISSEGKIITEISQPEFPGGMLAFYKFVGSNFKTPSGLKGNGKLYLSFMVEKDGSLSEFEILRDMGFGTAEEAIRVLKLSPKWIPGKNNNEPVRVKYSLPITIQAK